MQNYRHDITMHNYLLPLDLPLETWWYVWDKVPWKGPEHQENEIPLGSTEQSTTNKHTL